MEVPVQYFQSIIALELAVTGALLWQIHYFDREPEAEVRGRALPHPLVRGVVALVLLGTILGSLLGIVYGDRWIAILVGAGFMVSLLPMILRVLPALGPVERTREHQRTTVMTVVGLLVSVLIAAAFVIALLGS